MPAASVGTVCAYLAICIPLDLLGQLALQQLDALGSIVGLGGQGHRHGGKVEVRLCRQINRSGANPMLASFVCITFQPG